MSAEWNRYAELEVERRDLENRLKEVEQEMGSMESSLLAYMVENEMDKITLKGITFSPRRRLFAAPAAGRGKHEVADALVACGLGDYVRNDYNANSLSAYIASFDRETDETLTPADIRERLPEALREVVAVGEKWSIGATKVSGKPRAKNVRIVE